MGRPRVERSGPETSDYFLTVTEFGAGGDRYPGHGGGDQQILQPVLMVAVPVESLGGGTASRDSLASVAGCQGAKFHSKRPRPVGAADTPPESHAGADPGSKYRFIPRIRRSSMLLVRWPSGWRYAIDHRSRFRQRSRIFSRTTPLMVLRGPISQRPQPLPEASAVGGVVRFPDPSRDLRELVLQVLATLPDLEPRVQEALEDDHVLEQDLPGRLGRLPAVGVHGHRSIVGSDVAGLPLEDRIGRLSGRQCRHSGAGSAPRMHPGADGWWQRRPSWHRASDGAHRPAGARATRPDGRWCRRG